MMAGRLPNPARRPQPAAAKILRSRSLKTSSQTAMLLPPWLGVFKGFRAEAGPMIWVGEPAIGAADSHRAVHFHAAGLRYSERPAQIFSARLADGAHAGAVLRPFRTDFAAQDCLHRPAFERMALHQRPARARVDVPLVNFHFARQIHQHHIRVKARQQRTLAAPDAGSLGWIFTSHLNNPLDRQAALVDAL